MKELDLAWSPGLSVNHPELDREHKKLLGLCEKILSLVPEEADSREKFHEAINAFAEEMRLHFRTEEYLMKVNNYPEFEAHRQKHLEFNKQLAHLLLLIPNKRLGYEKIGTFLKEWVIDHLLNYDIQYMRYISRT